MKSTHESRTLSVLFIALALIASTVAFAGGVSGVQTSGDDVMDSTNEPESACDSGEDYELPGNCEVSITIVSLGVDTEDNLAGFVIRNDGHGGSLGDNVTYETSEGESGTAGSGLVTVSTSDDGSVTVQFYYDGEPVEEVQSDTDTSYDFGPSNDGTEDDTEQGDGANGDGGQEGDSDEQDDC
ncbi:hypothetical protein SAMN05421858_2070 [Haladaptatus litoreus]|uniref:Uncharacterized protein n=1 Tax=Haladaptatus litoreus TaxID=553468 RepID=A0A1N6ZL21_9EURY|nr:hypothetical protein [Haladaptatus litoreus]SIR27406.1 hypothetical protein SAMN05421858_2070 [Haladaptatus litoreus]